jgi:hypothetical protein
MEIQAWLPIPAAEPYATQTPHTFLVWGRACISVMGGWPDRGGAKDKRTAHISQQIAWDTGG